MQPTQSVSLTSRSRQRRHKLVGKELDLLLLAGCSCLLTLLYHPVAEALQPDQVTTTFRPAIATQIRSAMSQTGSIYLTLPPKREELQEEE